jgi:hypothetical protein
VSASALYPRYAETPLIEALTDSPVVLIHGPRQCGKTTLARVVGDRMGYAYVNFDDDVARGAAEARVRPGCWRGSHEGCNTEGKHFGR